MAAGVVVMMGRLVDRLIAYAKRTPYQHLPGYMERFWILEPRTWLPIGIRVHHILRSDTDRHLHDHPWPSCSIILRGSYVEVLPQHQNQPPALDQDGWIIRKLRTTGSVIFRTARTRHRLELTAPCWTVFITFGKRRRWGFYTPMGWIWWRQYLDTWEGGHD